ncbi:MAG: hypothetical protein IKE94_07425 [Aeriscardovia sp.]|nr:hypothetical protein [Aeriscardovia sp.]
MATTEELIKAHAESMRRRKKVEMGLYLSPNTPLSYNGFSDFVYTSVRGIGKTVIGLETAIILKNKWGWDNVKCYYFRTNADSIKALLTPEKAVDPYLVHKYDLDITKRRNQVYANGKLLYEAYPLVSAASIGKGVNLYDADWFTSYEKTGTKKFVVTIWDEFMLDDGLAKKSVGNPVKQYMIYREAVFRDAERLPYNAVYNFLLANNVSECAGVTGELFNYIPDPNKHKIVKLTRKHAMFWNVPVTEAYKKKRSNTYNTSLICDDDPNYNNVVRDLSLVKKKSLRNKKVKYIIAFSKFKSDWFCVYDGGYVKKMTPKQTYNRSKIIPMYRNQDFLFDPDKVKQILEMSDFRQYEFADIMSMAAFQNRMKEYKAK